MITLTRTMVALAAAVSLTLTIAPGGPASAAPEVSAAPASPTTSATTSVAAETRRAARPRCTVVGTRRADRLVGTPGRDVICGGGGNDVIVGRGGDDVLVGGAGKDVVRGQAGKDVLRGETGRDVVRGGPGDDELDGGPQADDLDGGTGNNVCTVDAADDASRCRYDRVAPAAGVPTFSLDEVDVTTGGRSVTVQVRVTDDVRVEQVIIRPGTDTPWYPQGNAELTSGTRRDGTWTARIDLGRWSRPGTYLAHVRMWDEVGHVATTPSDAALRVRNDAPDLEAPEVELLAPLPTRTYDVREAGVSVVFRVRMTDAGSGVDPEAVSLILWGPRSDGRQTQGWGATVRLESGNRHDGVWRGEVYLPEDSVSGTYQLGIFTGDLSARGTSARTVYWAEGEYQYAYNDVSWDPRLIPDGRGGVQILGRTRTDSAAPTVSGVVVSPGTVDTLAGPATVRVRADGVDTGRGIGGIYVALRPVGDPRWEALRFSTNLDRATGTIRQGVWTGEITLPRGAPPGRYLVEIFTWDRDQNEASYVSSSNPNGNGGRLLDTDPIVTVIESGPAGTP